MATPPEPSTSSGRWTGHAVLALRTEHRLTARAFAEAVGVSPRDVQLWENDATATISPACKAALDVVLEAADPDVQARVRTLFAPPAAAVEERRP